MEIFSTIGSALTVLSFVLFIGIVYWAWSGRRTAEFSRAAMEPFALDDDLPPNHSTRKGQP